MEVSKTVIKNIVQDLREKDYFNILFFSGGNSVLSEHPLPATQQNKKKAIEMVMSQTGGGGTEILDAFQRALALEKKKGLSRIIVVATDGYVSVEKKVFDLMRDNLDQANFFAFGIGSGVNRYLIEGIARVGKGEPFIATSEEEGKTVAKKFMDYIQNPLLTDIKVSFDEFDAYEVEPIAMPDLFAERPLVLFGKYKTARGEIKVTGRTPGGDYVKKIAVKPALENSNNEALMYLWAREKIARLADYGQVGEDVAKEVTELGLAYHLMTDYTSFVAVDKIVRETGEVVTVKQPLPLPQGVSDYAVGGNAPSGVGRSGSYRAPMVACEVKKDEDDGLAQTVAAPSIYITGGSVPAGTSLDDVEDAIYAGIKTALEDLFKKWELQKAVVTLQVENGKVKTLAVKSFTGKKCTAPDLEKNFKKLNLPAVMNGKIEITLEYS
jgi:Ca-activated chloride channel family protein